MRLLFVAVAAALSHYAAGDVSNSYLPAARAGRAWSGPLAVPMILSDGTIAETAEVAAARAAHLAALEAARASDPDMGRDDGEYDPHKYGDDLYGVVAHSEDLLQSILSYQALARGGAPVYGAPGAGVQSAAQGGAAPAPVYGAPGAGVQSSAQGGAAPAPVYGTPGAGVQSSAQGGAAPAPVYGAPGAGVQSSAQGGAAPAPVYGAPGAGVQSSAQGGAAPAPVYGAPGAGVQSSAQGGAAPAPVYGAPGAGMQSLAQTMREASAGGAVYGAPVQQNSPYTGPLAMLQLLATGYLADTPEVVAARNTHLKALQEAQAAAAQWRAKQAAAGAGNAHPWS